MKLIYFSIYLLDIYYIVKLKMSHYDMIIETIKNDPTKTEEQKDMLIKFMNKNDNSKFVKSSDHLKSKFESLISFIKFIEHNIPKSNTKIYGSFVRQMFEKMFLSSYDESGYGDSENHDVDLTVFDSTDTYYENKDKFNNIIDTFEVMEKLDFTANIKFGSYHLVKINDQTFHDDVNVEQYNRLKTRLTNYIIRYNEDSNIRINIYDNYLPSRVMRRTRMIMRSLEKNIKDKFCNNPHFNIILKDPLTNQYIIIDLFGYPIKSYEYNICDDINVNTISITRDGITCKYDFLTTLQSIIKRIGITKINMTQMKEDLKNILTFNEKSKIYNNMINFIGFRTKILSVGYTQILSDDQIYDIILEKTKACDITGAKPPYLSIILDCNHVISVMALSGIVNINSSKYSETINCPLCREKLMPKMIKNTCLDIINVPDSSIVSDIYQNGQSRRQSISINIPKPTRNEIISDENTSTIYQHLGLKPQLISYDVVVNDL
jgi:hypothetical protein